MAYPRDFILVRHGEAESNIAEGRSRDHDDHSIYTENFRSRHGSSHRLTPRGVTQAQAAQTWLKENGFRSFDEAHVSEYIRALETAGHLGLEDTSWVTNAALRERNSGLMDTLPENERQERFPHNIRHGQLSSFFGRPPDGESLADVNIRARAGFMPILEASNPSHRIIAVSHGRTIRILHAIIEHIPFWVFEQREREFHPNHVVHNAHIFHYTCVDPEDAEHRLDQFGWMRSICPWDLSKTDTRWRRIERPRYRSEDLLAIAERFPRLISSDEKASSAL